MAVFDGVYGDFKRLLPRPAQPSRPATFFTVKLPSIARFNRVTFYGCSVLIVINDPKKVLKYFFVIIEEPPRGTRAAARHHLPPPRPLPTSPRRSARHGSRGPFVTTAALGSDIEVRLSLPRHLVVT